jgi:hypothetical protein
MVIKFELRRNRLLHADAARRRSYVGKVRARNDAWVAGLIPLAKLCSDAGKALEDYAAETLDALLSGVSGQEPGSTGWILVEYQHGISRVGAALRDAIGDPTARHAVAQTLQERLLRVESHLRFVINDINDSSTARPQR